MSRLNYRGDSVKNFGNYLPSPIIEKILVYDDYLQVQTALIFPAINEQRPSQEFFDNIQNSLEFYIVYALNSTEIQDVINRKQNVHTLIKHPFSTFAIDSTPRKLKNYEKLSFTFLPATEEQFYDQEDKLHFKYTDVTNIHFGTAADPNNFIDLLPRLPAIHQNLTLFAFSSVWDVTEALSSTRPWFSNTRLYGDNSYRNYNRPPVPLSLLEKQVSDISYENVFLNGVLAVTPEVAYIDSDGALYNDAPLLSLDAKYHKAKTITHREIEATINEITANYSETRETNKELDSVLRSITYALKANSEKPEILSQLNAVRKAFPKQGGATPTGRLFGQFSDAIASINTKVKSNDILIKELNRSPKIIESRSFDSLPYSAPVLPSTVGSGDSDIFYSTASKISRQIYNSDAVVGPWPALNWGYLFFDFEKLVHTKSVVAQYFDTRKVERFFGGVAITNDKIKLLSTELKRYSLGSLKTKFKTSYLADATLPTVVLAEYEYDSSDPSISKLIVDKGYDGEGDHSYIALRSFNLASEAGLNSHTLGHEYRLMCFEFQDYYELPDLDPASVDNHWYRFTVVVEDRSKKTIEAIFASFKKAKNDFKEYLDDAAESCNFNSLDGVFKQSFSDQQVAQYESFPGSAPWERCPVVYFMHRDLLFDDFEGDLDSILEAAAVQSGKINPQTGTLQEIQSFWNSFEEIQARYDQMPFITIPALLDSFSHTFSTTIGNSTAAIDLQDLHISPISAEEEARRAAVIAAAEATAAGELSWKHKAWDNFAFGTLFKAGEREAATSDFKSLLNVVDPDFDSNFPFSWSDGDFVARIMDWVEVKDRASSAAPGNRHTATFFRYDSGTAQTQDFPSSVALQEGFQRVDLILYENPDEESHPDNPKRKAFFRYDIYRLETP